ncbi:hypothetical protein [Priestia megaterium]|uniref:Uncharacterized protein n=1 Tax=Priestia megaterium TaxID=1404 RepID=A0A6M6E008_PRIMG|nr:hypothetical protein [Priestia megaterium]QJX80441.1 hypothetical protein FDZ14_30605 [Priestia megaterium]
MDNLGLATRDFIDSVSREVFPEIKRWEYEKDNEEGVIELVQVDPGVKNEQAVLVRLEFFPNYIAVLIFNAHKRVIKIINRLLYSFYKYDVSEFFEVVIMPNMHSRQRIPTSDVKKEIMMNEIKTLEKTIDLISSESPKIERVLNLKRGIKMYEQFIINTQKKHLL